METIIGVVLGGVLAWAASNFVSWRQSRREHARWIREKRYGTYLKLLELVDTDAARVRGGTGLLVAPEDIDDVQRALAELSLLGPDTVLDVANDFTQTIVEMFDEGTPGWNGKTFPEERLAYISVVRKVIGITP